MSREKKGRCGRQFPVPFACIADAGSVGVDSFEGRAVKAAAAVEVYRIRIGFGGEHGEMLQGM